MLKACCCEFKRRQSFCTNVDSARGNERDVNFRPDHIWYMDCLLVRIQMHSVDKCTKILVTKNCCVSWYNFVETPRKFIVTKLSSISLDLHLNALFRH